MEAALNVAAYALGVTIAIGALLLGWLAFDLWFSDRFRIPHPDYVRLPCTALDAAREVYARMKAAYAALPARERRSLDVQVRRMEERVQHLEQKTLDEHAPYYKAVGRREKVWRGWKALHEQVRQMTRADRQRARHHLDEVAARYRGLDEVVKEEWERGQYRDKLMLEELRGLGVLDDSYLPKLIEQVRAHTAASPAEDGAGWQEPGVEPASEPRARAVPPLNEDQHHGDTPPGEGGRAAQEQVREKRSSISTISYELIREALAPLFGKKAPRAASPPPIPPEPAIPESDWKPAPPPPRVDVTPTQPAPVAPANNSALAAAVPPPLRQGDLVGDGVSAPGRRYADPAFSVAALPRGILRQADFSQGGFSGVRFAGRHRYLDCRFAAADLSRIQLEPQARAHQFVRCDFSGTKFDGSRIGFALFHECNLSGTHWEGARLEQVRFSECVLDGVEWADAEFVETRILSTAPNAAPAAPTAEATAPTAESEVRTPGEDLPPADSAPASPTPSEIPR